MAGYSNLFEIARLDVPDTEQLAIVVPFGNQGMFVPEIATEFDLLYGDFRNPERQGRTVSFEVNSGLNQVSILFELSRNLVNGDPFPYVEAVVSPFDDLAGLQMLGQTNGAIDVFEGAVPSDVAPVPIGGTSLLLLSALLLLATMANSPLKRLDNLT